MVTVKGGTKINPQQRKFAELVVQGLTQREAYQKAYPTCKSDKAANVSGAILIKRPIVAEYIEGLLAEARSKCIDNLVLTMQERREFLAEVVRKSPAEIDETSRIAAGVKVSPHGKEIKLCDKIKAIELDAKLSGDLVESADAAGGIVINFLTIQEGYRRRVNSEEAAA